MSPWWHAWRGRRGNPALRAARRLIVMVLGGTVLAAGLALTLLPGPAVLVIPLGLAILASEFVWAQRLLADLRARLQVGNGPTHSGSSSPASGAARSGPLSAAPRPLEALVMAGARGSEDAFLEATGAGHRALIPLAGKPLLAHVLGALRSCARIGSIHASIDPSGASLAETELATVGVQKPETWLTSGSSPARSALAALDTGLGYPLLVTTADHALLTAAILDEFLRGADRCGGDLVVGVVSKRGVLSRYPDTRRTGLPFSGETLCGANLFLLRRPAARSAVAFWTRVERDRKHPFRLVRHFGLWTALRFVGRALSFDRALELAGRRMGLEVAAVRLATPEAAIDIDNLDDLALAEAILKAEAD